MPLRLIHGPPNSGRAGLVRRGFEDALERGPVLVLPTVDDVDWFERELCRDGAAVGGAVMRFDDLFRAVANAAGEPPGPELTPAQRLGAVSAAVEGLRHELGPLRRSASRPGFAPALGRLLDELQGAGLEPGDVRAAAGTLEGSAHLGDVADLFAAYAALRDRLGRTDSHGTARAAIDLLRGTGDHWGGRPVLLYGFDDFTRNQLDLLAALAARAEVTVALAYEPGEGPLAARASLLEDLRAIGVATETETEAEAGIAPSPVLLSSAGERGEAEAIATEVARLIAAGADPTEIAVVLRDPARRGPLVASVLESYGVAAALEAEVPVARTSVGGTLTALLRAELGEGRAGDLLRFLRGPSGEPPGRVDWFEREIRRARVSSAAAALEIWERDRGEPPRDLARLREAAAGTPAELAAAVGRLAATMAARPLRGDADGPPPATGDSLELRAAAEISRALAERAELEGLAPPPAGLAAALGEISFRAWSGPVEGRVRIADPYRLRAARFHHVLVGSLQDGEFPRRERGADPFLSEGQRGSLGLPPRRDTEAEERYLFHACLALPRESLFLSHRHSDEDGAAEFPSPFLEEARSPPGPAGGGEPPGPAAAPPLRGRELASVVHPLAEAPSERELARAVATRGPAADAEALLAATGVAAPVASRVAERLAAARSAEAASRAPGPLSNPAAIEALAAVPAHGGTTLEEFDLCSYRWFVSHELAPEPLDPRPDPLLQGGIVHEVLRRLYAERPGGDPLPRPGSLEAWRERGRAAVAEVAAERGLGSHPAERAMLRRVKGLLGRFLGEEAGRETGGFEPWLLEAAFGEGEGCERPPLEIDGWRLHGAIDRVDRDAAGRALVLDYKVASEVVPREKLEERAKLQLQLYMVAVAERWDAEPVGGLYHPLRGSRERRPRGAVLDEAAGDLSPYGLVRTDVVDREGFEELLADARRRAREIVDRMRRGDIRRDPGPRRGLRGHDVCPSFCELAPICRRDRAPVEANGEEEGEER